MTGRILRLARDRGFGFIQPDGATGKDDHFFHRTGMHADEPLAFDQLVEGQRVTFVAEPSPKGLRACAVRAIHD